MCPTCPHYGKNAFAIVCYFMFPIHLMLREQHKMTFLRVCYPCMYLYGVCMHAFMYVSMVTHMWHSEDILGVGLWLLPWDRLSFLSIAVCVRLTGWKASRHDPVFTFHLKQGVRITHIHSLSHTGLWRFWGFELSSSYLGSKHFTHRAVSWSPEWLLKYTFLHSTFSCINIIFPSLLLNSNFEVHQCCHMLWTVHSFLLLGRNPFSGNILYIH